MSGRLLSAGLRLPRQVAADGRLDLMRIKCVLPSSHTQRHTSRRIYAQKIQHHQFHAFASLASQSRFGPLKSKKDDRQSSQEELNTAKGQDEPHLSRKEKRRERERRAQERRDQERRDQERQKLAGDEKSHSQKENQPKNETKRREAIRRTLRVVFTLAAGVVLYEMRTLAYWAEPLNNQTFSPFEIVDRQQVSPTAFIITVKPSISGWDGFAGQRKLEWLDNLQHELSRAGTWAVEIKQPELQVARDYTPLPDPDVLSAAHEDNARGRTERTLRLRRDSFFPRFTIPTVKFLIRKTDGGEVSSWLSRRKVGDIVELRGPHQSFNVVGRVGAKEGDKRVVFLAGGTGIAPALQAAGSLFQEHHQAMKQMPRIDIIWANRSREDCRPDNPVIHILEKLKEKSQGRINYVCTVDEERSFITANDIITKTQIASPPSGQPSQTPTTPPPWRKSWFWASPSSPQAPPPAPQTGRSLSNTEKDDADCYFHSPRRLTTSAGEDYEKVDVGKKSNSKWECTCCKKLGGGVSLGKPSFKNLIMVSGPEGFINHFTGPKYWADGKERQGPVGGVIGELARKYPSLASDWLVLKL
ncbi:putative cytochrome c mitochondrial import factor CYC2 [Triangularia setosa]|uniref:Cytochrome c mitochondrial import factor CYC2 n=1 Tax=Triangularia setosa TaxID=2587417 RepID=A0AAN7A8V9_9PEZI|nr:putative cytochrome c mitochondrial import factor CYC2 [Podospora setosa]